MLFLKRSLLKETDSGEILFLLQNVPPQLLTLATKWIFVAGY